MSEDVQYGRVTLPRGYIDPLFMNGIIRGQGTVEVDESGLSFVLNGDRYLLSREYPPGTKLRAWIGPDLHSFTCAPTEELEQKRIRDQAEAEAWFQEKERKQKEKHAKKREREAEVNASLGIPVRWHTAIKSVLSGLSETSDGNGTNRRTVVHVFLREAIDEGRFHRDANVFLCSGKNDGKQWIPASWYDQNEPGNARNDLGAVTCRECLKQAKRWQREPQSETSERQD